MVGLDKERGQIVPILAVVLVIVGIVGIGLVRVAAASARRAAAQAAADATALAGAADGRAAADQVALANDARIVAYRSHGLDVEVTVERRGVRAQARATWGFARPVGGWRWGSRSAVASLTDSGVGTSIPYTSRRVS